MKTWFCGFLFIEHFWWFFVLLPRLTSSVRVEVLWICSQWSRNRPQCASLSLQSCRGCIEGPGWNHRLLPHPEHLEQQDREKHSPCGTLFWNWNGGLKVLQRLKVGDGECHWEGHGLDVISCVMGICPTPVFCGLRPAYPTALAFPTGVLVYQWITGRAKVQNKKGYLKISFM